MGKEQKKLFEYLNTFENYLSAGCFVFLMLLLTGQVFSRFVLGSSITWTEELATFVFVWMIYLGVSGSVLSRKHLRIDFLLDMLPFKAKRALLVVDNLIFIAFNIFLIPPFLKLMQNLGSSTTTLLKIPKAVGYVCIPLCLLLSCIRLVEDCVRLMKESEKELGYSKPALDLYQDELYYLENKKGMTHEAALQFLRAEGETEAGAVEGGGEEK